MADDLIQRTRLAQSITFMRGSALPTDLKLVINELIRFELSALSVVRASGTRVVVCRNNVTDYLTSLVGTPPWDTTTGTFWAPTKEAVIAIVVSPTPHTPAMGEGTTSFNVTLRESMRGLDRNRPGNVQGSSDPSFQSARNADLAGLPPAEQDPTQAGLEECFCESAARFYGGDTTDATQHPNLHAYWAGHPLG